MKKSDLKNGMVIETKEGRRYIVIDSNFAVGQDGYVSLMHFNEDMKCFMNPNCDIMKVFKINQGYLMMPKHFDEINDYSLIWKRTDRITNINKIMEALDNMTDDEIVELVDKIKDGDK